MFLTPDFGVGLDKIPFAIRQSKVDSLLSQFTFGPFLLLEQILRRFFFIARSSCLGDAMHCEKINCTQRLAIRRCRHMER